MAKIKLMIADDHVLFRRGMASIIKEFDGISLIGEANNGVELLEIVKKRQPQVILMDLKMPEMDGIEATKHIHFKYPEIKIIVLSMFSDDKFILHLIESGASGYLLKNAEPDEVEDAIYAVLDNGFYFNEFVSKAMLTGLINRNKIKPNFNTDINLTDRETEVLRMICEELTNVEIAKKLYLSARTIEGYRNSLLSKIGAKNTVGLVMYAVKSGLVE